MTVYEAIRLHGVNGAALRRTIRRAMQLTGWPELSVWVWPEYTSAWSGKLALEWVYHNPKPIAEAIVKLIEKIEVNYNRSNDGRLEEWERKEAGKKIDRDQWVITQLLKVWLVDCEWPNLYPELYKDSKTGRLAVGVACKDVDAIVKAMLAVVA